MKKYIFKDILLCIQAITHSTTKGWSLTINLWQHFYLWVFNERFKQYNNKYQYLSLKTFQVSSRIIGLIFVKKEKKRVFFLINNSVQSSTRRWNYWIIQVWQRSHTAVGVF